MGDINTKNLAASATTGAATGAALGTIVPGVGNVVGGVVGGAVGSLGSLVNDFFGSSEKSSPLVTMWDFVQLGGQLRSDYSKSYMEGIYRGYENDYLKEVGLNYDEAVKLWEDFQKKTGYNSHLIGDVYWYRDQTPIKYVLSAYKANPSGMINEVRQLVANYPSKNDSIYQGSANSTVMSSNNGLTSPPGLKDIFGGFIDGAIGGGIAGAWGVAKDDPNVKTATNNATASTIGQFLMKNWVYILVVPVAIWGVFKLLKR